MPRCRGLMITCLPLLLALSTAPPLRAQGNTGTIRGTLTRAGTSDPVAGAQVFIVGGRLGGVTTADGRYSILEVPSGSHAVRVRALGFQPVEKAVEVSAGQTATADFALTSAPVSLDEVVVTGTAGSARKREVGNSIGQVKLSDSPEVTSNVSSLLTGKVAGVSIAGNTGNSGSGAAIRLRGTTSVALSNQPLIYVDGVRTRSDEYPRNGIFTGTTQRGANAYGSPINDINPEDIERIEIVKGAAAATLYGTDAAAGVIQIFTKRGANGAAKWQSQFNSGFSKLQKFGTDSVPLLYMDPFIHNGPRYGGNLQVAGGAGEGLRYLVSGGSDYNEGVLANDNEKKYVLRTNLDFLPIKKVAMSWSSAYTNNMVSQTPAGNNAQGITLNAFRRERNYFGKADPDTIRLVEQQVLKSNIDRLILGSTVTATPITNFSSRFTVGYDRAAVDNRNVRPYGFPNAPLGVIQDQRWANNTLSTDWVNTYELNPSNALKITASAGIQYVNSFVSDAVAYSENFPSPGDPTVASGALKNSDENRQRVITGGAFGQSLFGYKDRYFMTVGARIDGNTAFGTDFGFEVYPKISGSWVISEEPFWAPSLGSLKLRAAYGAAGRAPTAFAAVQTWSPVGWGGQPAVRPNNLGNKNLGPERTTEMELGFEESALSGRLGIDFTYFNAKTTDALFNVRTIPSNGFLNNVLSNVGEMKKSGIEVALTGTLVDRPRLGINAGVNLSTNHSEVVSLGGAPAFSVGNFGWVIEGQPAPVVRGKLIKNPDAVGVAPDTVGNYPFGPSQPTRIIGTSLQIRSWRNIQISARTEWQTGAYINEDASYQAISRSVEWPTCFGAIAKQKASQPLTVRETLMCVPANARQDMFIYKADFFKVRDITLTIPTGRIVPKSTSSSLVFTAQNIFRKNHGMPMFDPEMSGNDGFNPTVRYISEHIPAPAVFLTSLRVSF